MADIQSQSQLTDEQRRIIDEKKAAALQRRAALESTPSTSASSIPMAPTLPSSADPSSADGNEPVQLKRQKLSEQVCEPAE